LEVIKRVKASYPGEAEQEKLQGEVVLKIVVSETGDVESAEALHQKWQAPEGLDETTFRLCLQRQKSG
jgi:TonB family protein